ncbi:MAG: response regulator transcription factor [Bacteroidetes bacterium]|nr:response regulator transcription factor [Bacteroidota bacterium]
MSKRILLVEDEENLREAIKLNLEIEGYEVEIADTGFKATKKAAEQRFNLIVLDVMLPEMDGFAVCSKIRLTDTDTPILFLTAKDTAEDKIEGLKQGADDYLTKPFNLEELLLRVKILVKHSERGKREDVETKSYKWGGNEINFITFKAKASTGKEYTLTKKEVALLKLLIEKKNAVVSRQQILEFVWGYDVYPTTRTIDNFIHAFRTYFESGEDSPRYFHSVRGVGYKFTDS